MTTEIKLPAVFKTDLPKPAEVQEQIHTAFAEIYKGIEAEIEATPVDLTTVKGRDAIKSLAYKISRTKTGLDGEAKKLTEEQTAMISAVNAERKEMKETLDKLRDKARKPVDDWEAAEAERKEKIDAALASLQDLGRVDAMSDPAEIQAAIDDTESTFSGCDWLDYKPIAEAHRDAAVTKFKADLAASEKRIADEKELEELRALKAEQQRKAEEAAAEEARKAAEAQAELDRKAAEEAAAEAEKERERLANERAKAQAAEQLAVEAERARVAEERVKQAEVDAKAAQEKAERDRIEAEKQAAENERGRLETIAANERAAEEARAADLAHRKKINNAALRDIVKSCDVTEEQAKIIVLAIAKGHVSNVKITY